jgi:ABC-2 type transport system permease protein
MKTILIIARKEFRSAFRNRLFLTITALFLALSVLSVYIGSTTKRAEMRIYEERMSALTAQGATGLPPAPEIHTLTILSNLTEYVAIVGAILAVILGYNALIDEKESGGIKLILTRPVYRDKLLTGKLLGNAAVIAALLGLAGIFNLVLLVFIGGIVPSAGEVLRLVALIAIGFVYMSIFLIFATTLSISIKSSASVFLIALVFWMLASFVIPQMAQTQMANSAVINSISGTVNQIPQETTVSRAINFLSPTWHLREIGAELLQVAPGSAALDGATLLRDSLAALFVLLVPCVVAGAAGYAIFLRSETIALE